MLIVCPQCAARYQLPPEIWPTGADAAGQKILIPRKVRCRTCGQIWMALPEEDILELGEPLASPVAAAPLVAAPVAAAPLVAAPAAAVRPQPASPPLSARRQAIAEDDGSDDTYDDADPEDEGSRRRRWPWVLLALMLGITAALVLTGTVKPERYGLPAYTGPTVDLPAISLPAVSLPGFSLPTVRVPSTPPPPLSLVIDAQRREVDGRTLWDVRGTLSNPTATAHDTPVIELMLVDAGGQPLASWTMRPPASRLPAGGSTAFETSAIDPPAGAAGVRATLKPAGLGRM